MSYATRTELLTLAERKEADHTLPNGQIIRIREITAAEYMAAVEAGATDPDTNELTNTPAFYALLTLAGVIDGPKGQPLFTPDDLPALEAARRPIQNGWSFIYEAGDAIWQLSEVSAEATKSVGAQDDEAAHADADVRAGDSEG